MCVVFVGEGYFSVVGGFYPVVRDGYAMGVPTEVFDNSCGVLERPLGVDNPVFGIEGFSELWSDWKFSLFGKAEEFLKELPPVYCSHGFDRE